MERTGGLINEYCRNDKASWKSLGIILLSSDGKRYFIDLEKLNILEASIDSVIHFSKIDYLGQEMEELEVLYNFQKGETSDWLDNYYQLKELSQKQETRAYK